MPQDDSSEPEEWQVTEGEASDDEGSSSDGESIGSNDTDATDLQSEGSMSADEEEEEEEISTENPAEEKPFKFFKYAVDKEAEDNNVPLDPEKYVLIGGVGDASCSVKTQEQPPLPTANELFKKVMHKEDKSIMRGIATVHKGQTTVYVLDTPAADKAAVKALVGAAYKDTLLCAALATKALSWNNGKDELSLADKKRFRINKGAQIVLSTAHAKAILANKKPAAKRKRPTAAPAATASVAKTPEEQTAVAGDSAEKPVPNLTRKKAAKPRQLFQGKLNAKPIEKSAAADNSTPSKRRRTAPKPVKPASDAKKQQPEKPNKDTGFTDAEMKVLKKIAGFICTLK